jgi:hypothetical protein
MSIPTQRPTIARRLITHDQKVSKAASGTRASRVATWPTKTLDSLVLKYLQADRMTNDEFFQLGVAIKALYERGGEIPL